MSDYSVQISPNVTITFSSEQSMPQRHRAAAALQSFLDFSEQGENTGWSILQIAGRIYRFRYEVMVQRALHRAAIYNEAIQYIRSERGISFNPILADYAVEKLLEMLERDW